MMTLGSKHENQADIKQRAVNAICQRDAQLIIFN